jgi:hypothetical protein
MARIWEWGARRWFYVPGQTGPSPEIGGPYAKSGPYILKKFNITKAHFLPTFASLPLSPSPILASIVIGHHHHVLLRLYLYYGGISGFFDKKIYKVHPFVIKQKFLVFFLRFSLIIVVDIGQGH